MTTTQRTLCATLAMLFTVVSFATAHGQYVTRDEFNALRGQVKNLDDQVSQLVSLQRETLYALRGSRPSTPVHYASGRGVPIRYVNDETTAPPRGPSRSYVDSTETTVVVKIRILMSDSRGGPSPGGSEGYEPTYDTPTSESNWDGDDAVPLRPVGYRRPLPAADYGRWQSPSGYRYGY